MRVTYDAVGDAAYVELAGPIAAGGVASQTHSLVAPGGGGEIALDFDADGRLVGLEVLNASAVLPESVLADAVRID